MNYTGILMILGVFGALGAENLASPTQFSPLKTFGPPAIISPNVALEYRIYNQFDRTPRDSYYSVTNLYNNNLNPMHLSTGYYGYGAFGSWLGKMRLSNVYGVANYHYTNADNYRNGARNKVNFGYERNGANVVVGIVPNALNELKIALVYDNIANDKQPHYVIDAIKTERFVARADYRLGAEDLSNTFGASLSFVDMHREADNFTLRANTGQRMRMLVDRNIAKLNLSYDNGNDWLHNKFGILYTYDTHITKRFGAQGATNLSFNAYRIPDIDAHEVGIYDDFSLDFDEFNNLTIGIEYAHNRAKVNELNARMGGAQASGGAITPHNIWQNHYGKSFDGSINHNAFSAAVEYALRPNEAQNYTFAIESIERMPTNDERFVSLPPGNMSASGSAGASNPAQTGWASNPFLKPERRNRFKIALGVKDDDYLDYLESRFDNNAWSFGAHFIADYATDFIIWDRAGANRPVNYSVNNVVSRNINALLLSANANVSVNLIGNLGAKLSVYYNYGDNLTDSRTLYQIAPLEGILNVDFRDYVAFGQYALGTALRVVSKQTRGDFSATSGLGIDRKTAGFAVWDFYGSINIKDTWGLRFGVNNILDKEFYEFISGANVEAISPVNMVAAPGRQFYISFHGNF